MAHQTILVLDFGSQFTQLIARRLRELSVYCEILPFNTPIAAIKAKQPVGIILSGGPSSVDEDGAPHCDRAVLDIGVPTLGICYGMQLMTDMLGGTPRRAPGIASSATHSCRRDTAITSRMLKGMPDEMKVWASHGDFVASAPPGFAVAATSNNAPVAVMEAPERGYYALLFHPEVAHTDRGKELLRNFAFDVCGCTGDWTIASFIDEATSRIKAQVGDGRVVCGLSGGVDSTVAATLIHRAIGDRLQCIFVDNGLLRLNEAEQVVERYKKLQLPVHLVDASATFLDRLAGVVDPEQKRKIIGSDLHRHLQRQGRGARRVRFPGARHALSGRHRVGVGARTVGHDQEPSQRRRLARGHEVQAGRAAARAVQGRSARASAATSASTRSSWSGSRSRARAWRSASSARSRAIASRCCRRPTRSSSTRCARPAGTSGSGKASPCCCRCRASA